MLKSLNDYLCKLHLWLTRNDVHLCHYPNCFKFAPLNRQNTDYHDEDLNWARLCDEHQEEADAYWDERWKEYWAGRF